MAGPPCRRPPLLHTCRAIKNDLRKFARWFSDANKEPFLIKRVTTRDVVDFRNHLHRDQRQAVASINRALVSIRRFFDWLVRKDRRETNPANRSRNFVGSHLHPKVWIGLMCGWLLREIELREDIRAGAIFSLMLYSGCRVSDVVNLELPDLLIGERNGSVVFRLREGKQRPVSAVAPAGP